MINLDLDRVHTLQGIIHSLMFWCGLAVTIFAPQIESIYIRMFGLFNVVGAVALYYCFAENNVWFGENDENKEN